MNLLSNIRTISGTKIKIGTRRVHVSAKKLDSHFHHLGTGHYLWQGWGPKRKWWGN